MTLDFWGFNGPPYFQLPASAGGTLALIAGSLFLVAVLLSERQTRRLAPRRLWWHRPLTIVLALSAPFAAQMVLLRLDTSVQVLAPGIPLEARGPVIAVFGGLPWMLAGGLLGIREALLIGLIAGTARGGWETFSALTPVSTAIEAVLVAWLLRRDYKEWPGVLGRSPLISGVVGGTLFGALRIFEHLSLSSAALFDGLNYAAALAGPTLTAAIAEGAIAGAFCEGVRLIAEGAWFRPKRLVVGPYNRSLAARLLTVFLVLGVVSGAVLVAGDWFSVQASARELIQDQMIYVAEQTGGGLPFFIQTGRVFIRQIAELVGPDIPQGIPSEERLAGLLRSSSFFDHLALYGPGGVRLTEYPLGRFPSEPVTLEYERVLEAGLAGIPGEVLVPYKGGVSTALVFFTPVTTLEGDSGNAVLAGWADLGSNAFLLPVQASLEAYPLGEAYVTDATGRVLLRPTGSEISRIEIDAFPLGEVVEETAPDGSRRLMYVRWVEGYRWHVVVSTPLREIQRQATLISLRLTGILLAVGGVVILVVYAVSRRLTNPLRHMASAARSIARGQLDQPVTEVGDDEIGHLALSFEHMRRGLKTKLDEMGLLLDVSHRLVASFDLDQVLPPILAGVKRVTGADLVRFSLTGQDGNGDARSDGYQAGNDPGRWVTLEPQVIELCQQRGGFTLDNPVRAKAVIDFNALAAPIESLSALPVKHEGELVGVLWLGHSKRHSFAPEDIDLLAIVAGQLGVSIANARLFERAERERTRLMAVLESTPDVVIVTDPRGRISLLNPAGAALLNIAVADAIGKPAVSVIKLPELTRILLDPRGGTQTAEISIGEERVLFASVSEIEAQNERVTGRVCVLWDVTHYKRLDALKSEFVSTVSHDLRAPLTLMRGYATMLGIVGEMNEQQADFIRKILSSVDQMGRLVDNLLDLGRIEAGLGLELEQVQVQELIDDVVDAYLPQAANKQIRLTTKPAEGSSAIEVDPTLFRQAIANLVDNAVKYTPAGGTVTLTSEQVDGMQFVHVQDTGFGIAPADQARLFEKFYRARRSESVREKGLGLGLAIVKSIAEQHGGRVTFDSRLGTGSRFTLQVPIGPMSGRASRTGIRTRSSGDPG